MDFVAGAVFGDVGLSLFVVGAAFPEILIDSRSAKNVTFFHTKCVAQMGQVRSRERRVRDDDFIVGLSSDYARIILESSLYWRKQFRDFRLKS